MLLRAMQLGALAVLILPWYATGEAQERDRTREEREQTPRARLFSMQEDLDERAFLGVGTSSGGERDTLGLLITSITPGGPAEKAGLEEGNRIAAINGVRVQLSKADAGEPDMRGILSRRFTRELRKVKPGDEVDLRVYDDGQFRNVKVKTIAASESPGRRQVTSSEAEPRGVLGISMGTSGSKRDTLGIFVSGVMEDGPAEKAGVFEGDRIAAVNGVDVRVRAEDAGDAQIASARIQRFRREVAKAKPGDQVELRLYSDGGYKTVRVTLGSSDDYRRTRRGMSFHFEGDDWSFPGVHVAPMPPLSPLPALAPYFQGEFDIDYESFAPAVDVVRAVRVSADAARAQAAIAREHAARARVEAAAIRPYVNGSF